MGESPFRHRGVVEGFYGRPWSHADRLWMIERIGAWGMNRYLYAPKSDPLHREHWRDAYPDDEMRRFAELVERGAKAGVEVGFAIAPGLSITYSSADDRRALRAKLAGFAEIGARWFGLALDDVPFRLAHEADRRRFGSLGEAHADLARDVGDGLPGGARLLVVPTDYLGRGSSDYLETLGERLEPEIDVAWTGRTVVSPTIERREAALREKALRRRPLVWDNTPVSDGPMRAMLHLGPYTGRDRALARHACGVLLNPMEHARASAVTIRTAARYLDDPASFDPEAAWKEAVEEAGAGDPKAFECFARAHRFSPLEPDARDGELEAALGRLRAAVRRGRDPAPALAELRAATELRLAASARVREWLRDRALVAELEPWLASHRRETRRIEAALDFIGTLLGDTPRSARVLAFMRMEARLAFEPETGAVSYGPRRVLYPQLASMRDREMGFGRDPALYRNYCLADELVELAEKLALSRLGEVG